MSDIGDRKPRVLIVEDDASSRKALGALVESEGFEVDGAGSLEEARKSVAARRPDYLLVDLGLPDGSGMDLIDEEAKGDAALSAIVVTGKADLDVAVEAMRSGASDFLVKPIDPAKLRRKLRSMRRVHDYELETAGRGGGSDAASSIVGDSPAIREVLELVRRVGPTDAPVLVAGESGTGKELVARAVHEASARDDGPFVPVNCGAIPPQLTESQLFGHRKGSFTGAVGDHAGFFEQASGGTLFLDEITEMPIDTQAKLLRSLETGSVVRVGATEERAVDVRIVAATNRDPETAMTDGRLREDLYYRLDVFPIRIPPLRERGEDAVAIAESILARLNEGRDDERPKRLTEDAAARLKGYAWPGNVRELRNVVTRAFILADDDIEADDLTGLGSKGRGRSGIRRVGDRLEVPVGVTIEEVERELILATLDSVRGLKKEAAKILGVSVKTLYNRLKSFEEESD